MDLKPSLFQVYQYHIPDDLTVSRVSANFLTLSLHGCSSSDLFSQHGFFYPSLRPHPQAAPHRSPAPVWLWLIQLGSGSCSPWGKFTQLTADQLFSSVLHGKKDHAAHMINNNRWGGEKKEDTRAQYGWIWWAKRVSVSLSAHFVSLEIWFYRTELLMKHVAENNTLMKTLGNSR